MWLSLQKRVWIVSFVHAPTIAFAQQVETECYDYTAGQAQHLMFVRRNLSVNPRRFRCFRRLSRRWGEACCSSLASGTLVRAGGRP